MHNDFGLIGLAVMGQNLVLNVESRGFTVSVYNRTAATTDEFIARHPGKRLTGCHSLQDFVQSLAKPRKVMIMVKAGAAVDAVIEHLIPLLEADDIIIDGGNSLYTDTERRDAWLDTLGLRFVGAGVSGGEEGARKGPSIMPGGPASTWAVMRPIFEAIAAKVDGQPCVVHIGPGGAGHYVKMIHNGIEYGDMQLICEAYSLFKAAGFSADEMAAVFTQWNQGELQSYLIQITAVALAQKDAATGQPIVELILDKAGQKGTGQWTQLNAAENAVVISTINAAVEARVLSSQKDQRLAASQLLQGPAAVLTVDKATLVAQVHDALYASKIVSYAQGLDLDFDKAFESERVGAYERLLMDAIAGRLNLFVRSDEQEQAWRWVEPILTAWAADPNGPRTYAAGTWGPPASSAMVARDGCTWDEEQ